MKVDKVAEYIMDELEKYTEETADIVKDAVKETAEDVKKDIRDTAPVGVTGKYAKSWRSKKTSEDAMSAVYMVYATKDGYRLAHLLEFGHAKRNGGRTKAQPHIKPAEEKGNEELLEKLSKEISNGT